MIRIPLSRGFSCVIDDQDAWLAQFKWSATGQRSGKIYAIRHVRNGDGRETFILHRQIMNPGKGLEVDHIDGDTLNNQRSNLRVCSRAENGRNQKLSRVNKTGFKGVSFHKASSKFRATIKLNQKPIHLGLFENPLDAALVYDNAANELHGRFARLNFPLSEGSP